MDSQFHNNIQNGDDENDERVIDTNLGKHELSMGPPVEFERRTCFTPAFEGIRYTFRWLAGLVAMMNYIFDILYAFDSVFVAQAIFLTVCALIVLRIVLSLLVGQCLYQKHIRNYRLGMRKGWVREEDDNDEEVDERGQSKNEDDLLFVS